MTTAIVPTIENHTNGLIVTSETIAEGTDNQHKNVLQLIRTYREDLLEFGSLESETRNSGSFGGRPAEVFLLNEPQATLLLTYMRNMDRIRIFKKALVKAFYEMKNTLQAAAPQLTMAEMTLQVMGGLQKMVDDQRAQLSLTAPKAEAFDVFLSASGDYDVRDAAQLLQRDHGITTGQRRLFAWMREHGWLGLKNRPYQHRLDQDLLRIKAGTHIFTRTNGERQLSAPQVRITPKGLERLRQEVKATMEAEDAA